jgi:thiosulfate reductase cytochrome b subunit
VVNGRDLRHGAERLASTTLRRFYFEFPADFTLGVLLAGAPAFRWMVLALNGWPIAYGFVSGHFRKAFCLSHERRLMMWFSRPRPPRSCARPLQRRSASALSGVILAVIVAILSGLAIWKPVQSGLTH